MPQSIFRQIALDLAKTDKLSWQPKGNIEKHELLQEK